MIHYSLHMVIFTPGHLIKPERNNYSDSLKKKKYLLNLWLFK